MCKVGDGDKNKTSDIKKLVRQQFGRTAASYVTSEVHAEGADLQTLVRWLQPLPSWNVLDVATGGGHVVRALAPYVSSLVASDLTKDMLETARAHLTQSGCSNVSYVLADAESLPFLDETFDAVTCRVAAHHFPNPRRFVEEAYRVLTKGGKFLIIDNTVPENEALAAFQNSLETLRDPSHVACLAESEWVHLFSSAVFRIQKVSRFTKIHNFHNWLTRMVTSEDQAELVATFVRGASAAEKQHFRILEDGGVIESWAAETMVLLGQK